VDELRRARLGRPALAIGFLLLFGAYYAVSERLPDLSDLGAVLFVGFALSALAFVPVGLALPLRRERLLIPVWFAFVAAAVALYLVGVDLYASLPKLAAAAIAGFLFLRLFERLSWVVLLALLIPGVDTLSVWRGPTHYVVTQKPQVFDVSSIAFPVPGERTVTLRWTAPGQVGGGWRVYRRTGGGREILLSPGTFCRPADRCGRRISFSDGAEPAGKTLGYRIVALPRSRVDRAATAVFPPVGDGQARVQRGAGAGAPSDLSTSSAPTSAGLGLPDVLFFALFLGAAARFGLRRRATWAALVASLGLTTVLAVYANPFNTSGLPALPGISLAFLLVNADLIWRRLRGGEELDLDSPVRSAPQPER